MNVCFACAGWGTSLKQLQLREVHAGNHCITNRSRLCYVFNYADCTYAAAKYSTCRC